MNSILDRNFEHSVSACAGIDVQKVTICEVVNLPQSVIITGLKINKTCGLHFRLLDSTVPHISYMLNYYGLNSAVRNSVSSLIIQTECFLWTEVYGNEPTIVPSTFLHRCLIIWLGGDHVKWGKKESQQYPAYVLLWTAINTKCRILDYSFYCCQKYYTYQV